MINTDIQNCSNKLELLSSNKKRYTDTLQEYIESTEPDKIQILEYFNTRDKIIELEKLSVRKSELETYFSNPKRDLNKQVNELEANILKSMKILIMNIELMILCNI